MRRQWPCSFVLVTFVLAACAQAAEGPEPDRPRLLEAVRRVADGAAREQDLDALEKAGNVASGAPDEAFAYRVLRDFLRVLRGGRDEERKLAAWAVGQIIHYHGTGPADPAHVARVLAAAVARDPLPYVKEYCAQALIELKHPAALDDLAVALADNANPERPRVARALVETGGADAKALDVAAAWTGDADAGVRGPAFRAVALREGAAAAGRLVEAAVRERTLPRKGAWRDVVRALRTVTADPARAYLLKVVADTRDPADDPVRQEVAQDLADACDPAVAPALRARLRDRAWRVRVAAADAARNYLDAEAAPGLRDLVDGDTNPVVRWAAARALGAVRDAAAVGVLERAMRDGDPPDELIRLYGSSHRLMREEAAAALARIGDGPACLALYRALTGSGGPDDVRRLAESKWAQNPQLLRQFLMVHDDRAAICPDDAAARVQAMLEGDRLRPDIPDADRSVRFLHFLLTVEGRDELERPRRELESAREPTLTDAEFYDGGFGSFVVLRFERAPVNSALEGYTLVYRLRGDRYVLFGRTGEYTACVLGVSVEASTRRALQRHDRLYGIVGRAGLRWR